MNITGFSTTDITLSALGLNLAQMMGDFIFLQTPLGALAFASGFLLSLVEFVKKGRLSSLITFFAIFITTASLIIPKHQETIPQESKSLKDSIINYHEVPLLLSFINQSMDAVTFGLIQAIDAALPTWAGFSASPFGLEKICLNMKLAIKGGIEDKGLQKHLDKFIYAEHIPSLRSFYSKAGEIERKRIDKELISYFNKHPHLNQSHQVTIAKLNLKSADAVEGALIKSFINEGLSKYGKSEKRFDWAMAALTIILFFPIFYGCSNLILLAIFPLITIAVYLTRQYRYISRYLKLLLWVKSWALGGLLSSCSSFLIARVQAQTSSDISGLWDEPYFCLVTAAGLILTPIVTFVIINKIGGNSWAM